jgi:glycosyltransferase involved in cell wall biosynthesis
MLDAAYADWQAQTFWVPNLEREFVVVHDGTVPLRVPGVEVRCVPGENLGARRNLSAVVATGHLVAVWDDDDGHSRERLSEQVPPILAGADASVIRDVLLERPGREPALGWMPCGWPQTLVVRRDVLLALGGWPTNKRWDDDVRLLMTLRTRRNVYRIVSDKILYRYRRHASNVTGSAHWDAIERRAVPLKDSPWAHHAAA